VETPLKNPPPRAWRWLALIVLIHAALGVGFAVMVPPLEKLDEYLHWDYVRYLRWEGHLPDQRDPYIQSFPAEFHQPPLYYVPAALISSPIPFSDPPMTWEPINDFGFAFILTSIPDNANGTLHDPANLSFPWRGDWLALHVLRFYSVLISAATLIPMFWLAWAVFEDEALALGTVGWLAFRPSVLSLNSTVSNDPLLLLAGTAVLALCALIVARGPTWKRAIWLGVLLGLAALSKFTWPATAAAVPVAFALAPGLRESWKQRLGQLAAAGGIALVMIGWWFARNAILYGDLTGISLGAQAARPDRPEFLPLRASPPTWEEAGRVAWETFRRYWAHYGVVGMPEWANVGLLILSILLVGGLVYALATHRLRHISARPRAAAFTLIVLALYLVQIVVLFFMNEHGGQVRYVYAGFGAMAVVSQIGLMGLIDLTPRPPLPFGRGGDSSQSAWNRGTARTIAAILPIILMLPLAIYGLFGVLAPAYDLPRRVSDPALLTEQYDHPTSVTWMEGRIRLIGFKIEPETVRPGEPIFVTLCWQSGGPLGEALPYAVHVIDRQGGKIGERNTHPGLGMYATLYWQAGEAFCDRIRVPIHADAPTMETYRVVLSYFHEGTLEQVPATLDNGAVESVVTLGEIAVLPDRWPEAGPPEYLLGDSLAASGLQLSDTSLSPGEALTVRVTWQARIAPARDYTIFVHVLDGGDRAVAQTDQPPHRGLFPTSFWPRGAVVEDAITVDLADVPPGRYRVVMGLYDPQTLDRVPVSLPGGEALPDSLIVLGTIEVEP
jgi:hypothetical protein